MELENYTKDLIIQLINRLKYDYNYFICFQLFI